MIVSRSPDLIKVIVPYSDLIEFHIISSHIISSPSVWQEAVLFFWYGLASFERKKQITAFKVRCDV